MVERETLYNFAIIGLLIGCAIVAVYIFMIKPATDKTLEQKDFEEQRNIFLSKFCDNIGFDNYTIQNIGNYYNFYCYTDSSPISRVVTYGRYDWTKNDNGYTFFVLQEKR